MELAQGIDPRPPTASFIEEVLRGNGPIATIFALVIVFLWKRMEAKDAALHSFRDEQLRREAAYSQQMGEMQRAAQERSDKLEAERRAERMEDTRTITRGLEALEKSLDRRAGDAADSQRRRAK